MKSDSAQPAKPAHVRENSKGKLDCCSCQRLRVTQQMRSQHRHPVWQNCPSQSTSAH